MALVLVAGSIFAVVAGPPEPAAAGNAESVQIGMPFSGKWAYNVLTTAGCGSGANQTSHPSCHELYGYQWAVDVYAPDGTEVKLKLSNATGALSYEFVEKADGSCGHRFDIKVKVDSTWVGEIYFEHLKEEITSQAALDTAMSAGGGVVGKVDQTCHVGFAHTHLGFKNISPSAGYSCYINHSTTTHTAGMDLAEGTTLGWLGADGTDVQQVCSGDQPGGQPPAPTPASPRPAVIQRPTGETDVVSIGGDGRLTFHYNAAGTSSWGHMDIAGPGSALSAPDMVQRSNGETDAVVTGPGGRLDYYFNEAGSSTWNHAVVAPAGSAAGSPNVVVRPNGETDIVVMNPSQGLDFYYSTPTNQWGKVPISPVGTAFSEAAVVQRPNGETNVAVVGPGNQLDFYYNIPGQATFNRLTIALGGNAFSAPVMVQRPTTGETDVAVRGPSNRLDFYFNEAGQPLWGRVTAAGDGSVYDMPAMIQRPSGETDIVSVGPGHQLDFTFNAAGSQDWGRSVIGYANTAYSAPAVVQRPSGETDVVVVGPSNQLFFFINDAGSNSWGGLIIA